jgi:hypothetical protein
MAQMEHEVETQTQITAQIVAAAVREAAQATAQAVRETAQAAATVKENESGTALTAIAVLQTRQTSFEIEINKRMDKLDNTFDEIFKKLNEILQGRPPWSVVAIITILTGACTALLTYVFR